MCGMLSAQRILSGQMANRRFLLRPPEPSPEMLLSSPSESVYIGKTKALRVPFFWSPEKMVNPHLSVVGITGSGKSYFVKTFITRASIVFGSGILILDWAGEYSEWVLQAGGRVVEFGREGMNILELGGMAPHARVRQVMDSLCMLTDISNFPSQARITGDALEQAYLSRGFSLQFPASKSKKPPTLNDAYKILLRKGKRSSDSAEAAHRLKSLMLSSGGAFTSSTISLDSLLTGFVCVDLHSLPTESMRSLAGLSVLQFVKEKMRMQGYSPKQKPRLFVVVDEAWKIASDERSDVVSIVREGRKYGFSLIVASQNPSDVHRSIFSNVGTMACFRLTLASERDYVRSSFSYSDFFEKQSHSLSVGQALFHLEFSQPVACPRTFILNRVDGEEPLSTLSLRGVGMDLEFERSELSRKLLSFGLAERQLSALLSDFESHSHSLDAAHFVLFLERLGHSKASVVSLLRELGADEKDILPIFSSAKKGAPGGQERIALLSEKPRAKSRK